MAMTKKNYEAIAKAIREERENWKEDGNVQVALSYLSSNLSSIFAAHNERFDRVKFQEAARVDWSQPHGVSVE